MLLLMGRHPGMLIPDDVDASDYEVGYFLFPVGNKVNIVFVGIILQDHTSPSASSTQIETIEVIR